MAEEGKNPFVELLGSDITLKSHDNSEKKASSLTKYSAVGFYFSAHWCPPCRAFTPQLAQFYKNHHENKNFEIIFVSSDKDEKSFEEYWGEQPWLSLPFGDKTITNKLSRKYKVEGIPTLVFVDSTGKTITTNARAKVSSDPEAQEFPWLPKTFWELFDTKLISSSEEVDASSLKSKTALGIYFSAHWCPPCRGFTPKLVETYKKLRENNKDFEIVFVSSDRDEQAFKEYFSEMPWLALPYSERKRKEELSSFYEVEGIPTFVIIDPSTGKTITAQGRGRVSSDPEGKEFPWHPKPLNDLDSASDEINEPCFIYFDSKLSDEKKGILAKIAEEYKTKWGEDSLLHFFYCVTGDMGTRVKEFTNAQGDPLLMILNIPEGEKYISDAKEFNEATFRGFVEDFIAKKLPAKGIKE